MGAFERALEFQRRTTERIADSFYPIDSGFVARSPSIPEVWSGNHVHITRPVSFDRLVSLADEHLSELPYRQVSLDDDATGRDLEESLQEAGWRLEREVVMELRRPADHTVDTSMVFEAGEDEMLALMERWHLDGLSHVSENGLRQLKEWGRRENRTWGDRSFAVAGDDGRLAAITKLRIAGDIAQVEDVFTAPEARGRGYGRAVVSHAVNEARHGGHNLIFIVADDNDWPKHLYEKLGFDPIGWTWSYHRSPAMRTRRASRRRPRRSEDGRTAGGDGRVGGTRPRP
jgi:GNAT superfamily N-acetyltransferase